MSVKTEPVLLGGGIATVIAAADPVLQLLNIDSRAVSAALLSGAVAILTIAVLVRQFVTPTSKLGKDIDVVERAVGIFEPGAQPLAPPAAVVVIPPPGPTA